MRNQSFSPRNGEVILKVYYTQVVVKSDQFQSPQWGSNSKEYGIPYGPKNLRFQSPQWGSNSKGYPLETA